MNVVNIRAAKREGARTLTVFAGVSGSGKTHTAILYAYGLAGYKADKVGLLDTENRRGSLFAEVLESDTKPTATRFQIGDLAAPFSPERYVNAVRQFQAAGTEVLIIDSGTHEWEGVGGCDDIANAPDAQGVPPKMARWNKAKREHKRFVNALLQSDMDIVCCLRAREKVKISGSGEKAKIEQLGIQPICEKNFMFEATISLLMHDAGTRYDLIKVPAPLAANFPGKGYIGSTTGAKVRAWVQGAAKRPAREAYRDRLMSAADQGEAYVQAAWLKVPEEIRSDLGKSVLDEVIAAARAFDRQRSEADHEEPEAVRAANRQAEAPQASQAQETGSVGLPLDFKE